MNDTSDTEEDTDEAEEHDEDAALEAYISDARRNYIPASRKLCPLYCAMPHFCTSLTTLFFSP